jgi:hypothetical protein
MTDIAVPGNGIIFMKVGTHAGEELGDIIARKKKELDEAGEIFWGYGGPTCHPLYHVQPFVKELTASGHAIYLVMEPMLSRHFAEPKLAEQYSQDGVQWDPVPEGVHVLGSRYALVLGSLELEDTELDLKTLRVGIGTSMGKPAADYVKRQVDKGCFIVEPTPTDSDEPAIRTIGLVATLKAPYAVFLR